MGRSEVGQARWCPARLGTTRVVPPLGRVSVRRSSLGIALGVTLLGCSSSGGGETPTGPSPPPGPPAPSVARQEIWAYGLRNPWRFAFDVQAGLLYIIDAGEARREEVNIEPISAAGLNYGWRIMEGSECFQTASCDRGGLTLPKFEYEQSGTCTAIVGGSVYRGTAVPEITGHFFYSDFCKGWLRSFRFANGEVVDERDWQIGPLGSVLSFGEDAAGELYVLSVRDGSGEIRKIVRDLSSASAPLRLEQIASGLGSPTYLTAPAEDARLFITERAGRIRILRDGALLPTPFLDITDRVNQAGHANGLLSLAFHPNYRTNGRFYVAYSGASNQYIVERYNVTANPDAVDRSSSSTILVVEHPPTGHPTDAHYGGHLRFGPDRMLYIAVGDGSLGGDPANCGQDRTKLCGSLLRINVDAGEPYTIPPDNPFAASN